MKRYTASFQAPGLSFSTEDLKTELSQVLMRLHPRITYKVGQAFKDDGSHLLVQIAVDGKRELLNNTLMTRQWNLPVRFETLSWGWLIDDQAATSTDSPMKSFEFDPLKEVIPPEGEAKYILSRRQLLRRYIFLTISTLVLIAVLATNIIYPRIPWLMGLYVVIFTIFMFTLGDTPLDLRVYGEKIAFQSDRLEVKFWLLSRPATVTWAELWGVDYANPVCSVFSKDGRLRFLLSERYGCKEQDVLLKAIVDRAALRFVEGNFRKLSYRKPEAIDSN